MTAAIETRTVPRFAWLPVRLTDGGWLHLDWYEAEQRLTEIDLAPWGSVRHEWETVARHPRARHR